MRNYPLLIGAGVALVISSLVGAAALTGALPRDGAAVSGPMLENTATAAAAKKANCRTCGVVAAVRKVALRGEKDAKDAQVYRVTVRMDDGSERTVTLASAPAVSVGVRVRVNGNVLERG